MPISNEYDGGWQKVEGGFATGPPTRDEFLSTLSNVDGFLVRASLFETTQEMAIK